MFTGNVRIAGMAAAALVAVLATACEHSPSAPGSLASITVTTNPDTMAAGSLRQFTATGRDARGTIIHIDPSWAIAAGGGSVNSTGIVTAGQLSGTFANTITATVGSISGSATLTVIAGPPASIVVTPSTVTLAIGATQQFTAVVRDAGGNIVTVAPSWSIAAGGGSVNSTGLVTAGTTSGSFANTVTASVGSLSGTASLTVIAGPAASIVLTPATVTLAAGATQQFTAVVRDAGGNILTVAPSWTIAAGGGSVNGTGLFTAGATAGTFMNTVRASVGTLSATSSVTVTVPTGSLASITVTPNPRTLAAGGTQQFTATGHDGSGNIVPVTATWSVQASGGTINSGGLFTAGTVAGTYTNTVRACSTAACATGSVSGFATITVTTIVTPPPVGPSLGAAATHGILAGSAVTCASAPGSIDADVSVWPGSAITGFPPCTITGETHAADAFAQTAQGDLTVAYLALEAMACDATITSDLGGTTLAPGVYCSLSSVGVTGVVTLSGPANAIFVIRAPSTLTTAGSVVLSGGAQAKNVFWLVGSSATIGTGSGWQGNIIALTSITLNDNVTLVGRALARNGGVSLGTNTVIVLP